ncbi:MAG: hypothetical protein JJU34_07500 [Lunatimonas sp.]|uniref:hypothetical protein n=1 Tax=Lunatimonas sp. TaxID=2060141 RepID=UPI00263A81A4|nr:hypothetical protein [Lunatimonas sp.]MCC5937110.1 hypothetical protein [Lunatimonas sp.]
MNRYFLLLPFWLLHAWAVGQETQRTLYLNAGTQHSWERDHGYSPLVYSGSAVGFTLGCASIREKKTDEVYIHYSRLPLQNAYAAEMIGTHASIMTYTFYRANWLPEQLDVGWSNNNALSLRNYQDAQNFTPRFDFHTSFGPTARYQQSFGTEQQWRFAAQAHVQVIGFLFAASYLTSPPDPFLHEQSTFQAFMQSIRLFQPFRQHDLGMFNQLFYRLSNGNEIGIGYRWNYSSLENTHRSQRSGGHYFIQLNFQL